MSLLSDLSALLVKYARPVEVYLYTLVGGAVASTTQIAGDKLSFSATATTALIPAAVALAHDVVNDLRQLRADAAAVKAAAKAAPAQDSAAA